MRWLATTLLVEAVAIDARQFFFNDHSPETGKVFTADFEFEIT